MKKIILFSSLEYLLMASMPDTDEDGKCFDEQFRFRHLYQKWQWDHQSHSQVCCGGKAEGTEPRGDLGHALLQTQRELVALRRQRDSKKRGGKQTGAASHSRGKRKRSEVHSDGP